MKKKLLSGRFSPIHKLPHKYWARGRSTIQHHLSALYGTYSCRVVQNKSKECRTNSLHWIAYKIQLILLKSSSWPISANCLHLWMELVLRGTAERVMFSASFNAKTDVVQFDWQGWAARLSGGLYTFHISHFKGILQVFSQCTPRNMKHLLYTFCISFKFCVSFQKPFWLFAQMPTLVQKEWSSKATSVLPQKQMKKVPDWWKKLDFVLSWPCGVLSINTKPQNLWFQTLLINSNHWKHFKKYLYAALFRGMWWKINRETFRSMKTRPIFCTS